jgi:hypothetical protein
MAAGGGEHLGKVVANLFGAAAGQKADPDAVRVEVVLPGELVAGDGGQRQVSERVADELGADAVVQVKLLLEGEDDEHLVDVLLDELNAVLLPGP